MKKTQTQKISCYSPFKSVLYRYCWSGCKKCGALNFRNKISTHGIHVILLKIPIWQKSVKFFLADFRRYVDPEVNKKFHGPPLGERWLSGEDVMQSSKHWQIDSWHVAAVSMSADPTHHTYKLPTKQILKIRNLNLKIRAIYFMYEDLHMFLNNVIWHDFGL